MHTATWPLLLTYPQHLRSATRYTLDALECLLPVPGGTNDGVRVSRWLDGAVDAGLLSSAERGALRTDIAPNL